MLTVHFTYKTLRIGIVVVSHNWSESPEKNDNSTVLRDTWTRIQKSETMILQFFADELRMGRAVPWLKSHVVTYHIGIAGTHIETIKCHLIFEASLQYLLFARLIDGDWLSLAQLIFFPFELLNVDRINSAKACITVYWGQKFHIVSRNIVFAVGIS